MINFRAALLLPLAVLALSACNQKADTNGQANLDRIVAQVGEHKITHAMLMDGIENDVYEAEKQIHELKQANLRDVMLGLVLKDELKAENLSQNEYAAKYITNNIVVNEEDISAFATKRRIPESKLDEALKQQIREYLSYEKKLAAIDRFIEERAGETGVKIHLTPPEDPVIKTQLARRPSKGPENAKVTIVEYSDFECPYCKRGANIVNQLLKRYPQDLKVIFKNFPLAMHRNARSAAEAGMCAYQQSNENFWLIHDKMFEKQKQLTKPKLITYAQEIGLEVQTFTECLESRSTKALVDTDMKDAAKIKLRSTPTFIINGERIDGLLELEDFAKEIDRALKKATEK